MSALYRLAVIALAISSPAILKSADDPKAEEVVSAMEKAVSFYRENLSVDGGYASGWTMDPLTGHTEHHSGPTVFFHPATRHDHGRVGHVTWLAGDR